MFAGWTSVAGTGYVHPTWKGARTTTHPTAGKGTFADAKALTTTFTMPANDVIVTANYRTNPK